MKTINKIILVTLMFGTLIGYAEEITNSTEFKFKKVVKIEFKNVRRGHDLTIKNEKGETVYSKEIKVSGNYSQLFNFSSLENGLYTAELHKDFEININRFIMKNGLVSYFEKNIEKIFKPMIRTEKNLLYISKLTFNKESLDILIYYKDEVVMNETIKGDGMLNRIYKLSESRKGNYKIIINSENRIFKKEFTL